MTEQEQSIRESFLRAGIPLAESDCARFVRFYKLLTERNKVMNLTAITGFNEVLTKHFIDSAVLLPLLKDSGRRNDAEAEAILDVGSGAGFPGVPLAIVCPDAKVTLLDALENRVGFLNDVIADLGLSRVTAVHGRTEDLGKPGSEIRESFPLVVSRAVAPLPVLAEWCLPFVKKGGLFAAYKGNASEEIENAGNALRILGGVVEDVISYTLPDTEICRQMVLIRKNGTTPLSYPRKPGKAAKKPL